MIDLTRSDPLMLSAMLALLAAMLGAALCAWAWGQMQAGQVGALAALPLSPMPRVTISANGIDVRVIVTTPDNQWYSRRYYAQGA
jgi:hypothetical protein